MLSTRNMIFNICRKEKFKRIFNKELLIVLSVTIFFRILLYGYLWFQNSLTFSNFGMVWSKWDSFHYLRIAQYGYLPGVNSYEVNFMSRFPPVYPILIKVTKIVTGIDYGLAGICVSLTATILSSILIFKLAKFELKSNTTAYLALIWLNIYPTSFIAVAVYSESLFILFLLSYFYFIRVKNNYLLGGIAAALMVGTRTIGVVVYPVHAYFLLRRVRKKACSLLDLVSFVAPGIAFLLFKFYQTSIINKPGYQFLKNTHFLDYPFQAVLKNFFYVIKSPLLIQHNYTIHGLGWSSIFVLFVALVTLFGLRAVPLAYSILNISYILLLSMLPLDWGFPRYTFACFPVFLILAKIPSRAISFALMSLSIALLADFAKAYLIGHLF